MKIRMESLRNRKVARTGRSGRTGRTGSVGHEVAKCETFAREKYVFANTLRFGFAALVISAIFFLMLASSVLAENSKSTSGDKIRVERIDEQTTIKGLSLNGSDINAWAPLATLSAIRVCTIQHAGLPAWRIFGWIIGNEVYNVYQDPEELCPGAYPFTITEVHFILQVGTAVSIPIRVEIEAVDLSVDSTCPIPGEVIHSNLSGFINFPSANIYDVVVPLDSPVVVNGPYFLGLHFEDTVFIESGLELITDGFQVLCRNYNFYDTLVGFLDLGDDTAVRHEAYLSNHCCYNGPPDADTCANCFDFDGSLIFYSVGEPGGEPPEPEPSVAFIGPRDKDTLYSSMDFWIGEAAGSKIIDSAVFWYDGGSGWIRLGVDADKSTTVRKAIVNGPGAGYSYFWDFSSMPEGDYSLKAAFYDTLGREVADSINVYLEPTPPVPILTSHSYFDVFCSTTTVTYTNPDENASLVVYFRKPASLVHSKSLINVDQFAFGDANGNALDGNLAANGEFGDYYGGPAVGAIAIKYWFDQGFTQSMGGGTPMTITATAELLADFMLTRENLGTDDFRFIEGFRNELAIIGFSQLKLTYTRQPSYAELRNRIEEVGALAMIGIAGSPGRWLAVDGAKGRPTPEGILTITVSDPFDETTKDLLWDTLGDGSAQVLYENVWTDVEIIAFLLPSGWVVPGRTPIPSHPIPGSQLTLAFGPDGLTDDSLYFLTVELSDLTNLEGFHTQLFQNSCILLLGDYDGNKTTNVDDVLYLVNYFLGGPEPVGGAFRADLNCSDEFNTGDLVYYINWLFGAGPDPCQ